jgi:Lrp/AsnC family transcriptional regulator for asnA, asnC and gidA
MRDRIDDIDRAIIGSLQVSARRSNVDIASDLGLSESTVRRRVEKLIDGDYVRIVAVADPLKIGYPVVAIIGLECPPAALADVEAALLQLDEFRFIGMTSGPYDFVAEAWFSSLNDLQRFITQRLSAVAGISRIETTHVLKMVRYMYDWGRVNAPSLGGPSAA